HQRCEASPSSCHTHRSTVQTVRFDRGLIRLRILGEPMLKLVITVTCLSAVAAIAEAQSGDLTGQEIAALVAGATIEIDTPVGSKLRVSYTADGHLHGQARQLALYRGAGADRGRWWVASNQLCHAWEHWFNSEPQCLRLRRDGRKLQWWRENGQHGTAVLTA